MNSPRRICVQAIVAERERQLRLKAEGRFSYTPSDPDVSELQRLAMLTEEVGEVAPGCNSDGKSNGSPERASTRPSSWTRMPRKTRKAGESDLMPHTHPIGRVRREQYRTQRRNPRRADVAIVLNGVVMARGGGELWTGPKSRNTLRMDFYDGGPHDYLSVEVYFS